MKLSESDNNKVCKTCGATIPESAPGGLCPACVLLGSQTEAPLGGVPSVDQIAAAFTELEIIGLVGRGGMGAVYHARQEKLDRDLALKILLPDLGSDPAFAERFAREARALAKLNHPNIVAVYDFGEQDGLFYLMMEFVDGVNLRQAMAAGRFTPEQALAVIPGICDALQAAHGMEILHRDIKPENILLDRDGKVKIVDFGIARLVGDADSDYTLTEAGAMLGSRQYMAPEQLERREVIDHRADIYSLGVVFYEMLTGELPIGRFLPPSEKSLTTEEIDAVVMRTLEKELDRRFQNVADVKTEIEKADANRPVPAKAAAVIPPGSTIKPARMSKATLFVLTLAVIGAVTSVAAFLMMQYEVQTYSALIPELSMIGPYVSLAGYVGCWVVLRSVRRGRVSMIGRGWLQVVTIGLPLLPMAALMSAYSGGLFDVYDHSGSIFLTMICVASVIYLLAVSLVCLSGFKWENVRAKSWMWRFVALLMAGSGAMAGKLGGQWPYAHSKMSGTVYLPNVSADGPDQQALEAAAGKWLESYDVHWDALRHRLDMTVIHEERSGNGAAEHVSSFGNLLIELLPANEKVGARVDYAPPHSARDSVWMRLACFGLCSAVIATGLALLGFPGGAVGMVAMLASFGAMVFWPGEPYPTKGPQLVEGSAPATPLLRDRAMRNLSISRAEAMNTAISAFSQSRGKSRAELEWDLASDGEQRYQLLRSFLPFPPDRLSAFTPEGYRLHLPRSLEGKVTLSGPDRRMTIDY